jgi:hypothetical protein|tara:strand:+ start:329 stop:517 length:189 start_codon:yes stop_codon:yes gene_type:complete
MTKTEIENIVQKVNQEKLKEHTEMRKLLVEIIRTLDDEYFREVQSTKNSIGLIRSKIDKLIN